ncbi:glycosyltransferase [Nocardia sp. NPDC046763]|uniref:glycosyltransferase n=1 Tax=Nocardia sp. NPDC046763 TaxID=3155256 RepID=UPI0033E3676C
MSVEAPPPRTRAAHLVHGERSRKIGRGQLLTAAGAVPVSLAVVLLCSGSFHSFLVALSVAFSAFALVMSSWFLISLVYMQREGGLERELLLAAPGGPAAESIAVLIPARHETDVLAHTLLTTVWTQRDHDRHRVIAVVNDDDPETAQVAAITGRIVNTGLAQGESYEQMRRTLDVELTAEPLPADLPGPLPDGPIRLIVYPLGDRPPNKPQQLNHAFWRLRSEFTVFTVLDAESIAAPGLLRAVDQAFQDHPGVAIIQGGIQLMDPQFTGTRLQRFRQRLLRWYSWHNLLEYKRWFSSQMRYQSDRGFMPLGGNTVFLRTGLLIETGAWPMSLTEDCELAVRATAVHGARTLTFYDPGLTTREETPPDLATLIKQRRRWNIGFLQSFVAGNWRSLPTFGQRVIAAQILSMSLFQTISFAVLPLTLATVFWIKSPAPLAVAMCVPAIPIALAVALQMLHLHEFGKTYQRPVPWHVYVLFALTFYPYQLVLSYAAIQSVVWYALGRLGWDKTAHVGDHFQSPAGEPALTSDAA